MDKNVVGKKCRGRAGRANFRFPNRIALYLSEATWIENKYQSLTIFL